MIQIGCKVTPELLEELKMEWEEGKEFFPTFADYLRQIISSRKNNNIQQLSANVQTESKQSNPMITVQKSINQYEELLLPFFEKAKGSYVPFKAIDGKESQFAIEKPIDVLKAILKTNKIY